MAAPTSKRLFVVLVLAAACARRGPEQPEPASPIADPGAPSPATAAPVTLPPLVGTRLEEGAEAGSSAAVTLEAASSRGHWIVFCQPLADTDQDGRVWSGVGPAGQLIGDVMTPHLALAGRAPEPIDAYWGADPSERVLLVSRAERLELWDTQDAKRHDLSGLGVLGARAFSYESGRKTLAFDDRAGRLYLPKLSPAGGYEVAAWSLSDGSAASLFSSSYRLQQLRLAPSGGWLFLQEAAEPGQAQQEMPLRQLDDPAACHSPNWSASVWPVRPGAERTQLFSIADKTARVELRPVLPFGEGLLLRDERGRLLLERGGKTTPLTRPDCGAVVVHASPRHQRVLVGCAGPAPDQASGESRRKRREPPRTRWPLWLVGPGFERDLKLTLAPTGEDRWPVRGAPRFVALHAGADTVIVDLKKGRTIALSPGAWVVHVDEEVALVVQGDSLTLVELPSGRVVLERSGVAPAPLVRLASKMAFVSPFVVDLGRKQVLGRNSQDVLALASDGRVLVAKGGPPEPSQLALGPLVWEGPSPSENSLSRPVRRVE